MKLESEDGNRQIFSEFVCGRTVRATTVGGEAGARRIFEIIRLQNGVATSPALRQDTGLTYFR
jgi:hypothetical protein